MWPANAVRLGSLRAASQQVVLKRLVPCHQWHIHSLVLFMGYLINLRLYAVEVQAPCTREAHNRHSIDNLPLALSTPAMAPSIASTQPTRALQAKANGNTLIQNDSANLDDTLPSAVSNKQAAFDSPRASEPSGTSNSSTKLEAADGEHASDCTTTGMAIL